ncbi:sigma-54 dependent transcriptional regulator [Marinobacterium sp. CAU 1594]|nr:sigma-54 dependent transcriptional regulator [Marinobacterium arenosum]
MQARRALFLDLSDDGEDTDVNLKFPDWEIERVTSCPLACARMNNYHYHVGLARVVNPSSNQLNELDSLFYEGDEGTAWIALTKSEDLSDQSFRRMIYEHFYDYFTLPLMSDASSYLKAALGHAYGISMLRDETQGMPLMVEENQMVGASQPITRVFQQVRKIAGVDAPVLIRGDTGTGKEMVARAIHQRSERREYPFVAVNCGALPDTLIHAELFGHEKGAFTGAFKRKIGRIEAAQHGTIFLDEIGDLPLDLQVYLLRFLEESTIERLGSNESLEIDARVIAATHVNLEQAVERGRFREDLYYRLNVLSVDMPPLAQRDQDIELLARYFFHKFAREYGTRTKGFTNQALQSMAQYNWPGNIREMINRIRRALVMSENRLITPHDLGLGEAVTNGKVMTLDEARSKAEELAVKCSLHHTRHNISNAAKLLGVSRVTLYRLIEKYAIRESSERH